MSYRIKKVIQHADVVHDIDFRKTFDMTAVLHVADPDIRELTIEAGAQDRFDYVLDSRIDSGDSAGVQTETDGVDALKATDFEDMLVGKMKVLIE